MPKAQIEKIFTEGLKIHKGSILEISEEDGVLVSCDSDENEPAPCNFLRTSDSPMPVLKKGDRVMLTLPEYPGDRGCILGIIENYSHENTKHEKDKYLLSRRYPIKEEDILKIEDEVVNISANKGIVIKCGKGSITITEDGRIKIEGTYLLNRSSGVNKIKGGSVRIN
ncbi:MAG: hypothetical protein ACC630_05675 [Nitrospinota bacterium]